MIGNATIALYHNIVCANSRKKQKLWVYIDGIVSPSKIFGVRMPDPHLSRDRRIWTQYDVKRLTWLVG